MKLILMKLILMTFCSIFDINYFWIFSWNFDEILKITFDDSNFDETNCNCDETDFCNFDETSFVEIIYNETNFD